MEKRRKIMLTVGIQGIFIILSVFYVVMMAPRGTLVARDSLDAYFHLTRIQALDNVWQSPINFAQWNHVGNATTLFYPWLTVLPALPLFHWLGPVYGFLVFLGLVTYTTLVAAFISYRKYRGNKAGAFLFALLYTFSFIRATSVLYRWGVGEYIAMIFVPPLFLAFRAVLQAKWQAWPYVALWFALIMYSHFLSAAITAVALIILFLGALVKHFGQWGYWRALGIRALRFAGLTLVLTMGYWGPLVEQELTQPLGRPAVFNVAKAGQSLQKLVGEFFAFGFALLCAGRFLTDCDCRHGVYCMVCGHRGTDYCGVGSDHVNGIDDTFSVAFFTTHPIKLDSISRSVSESVCFLRIAVPGSRAGASDGGSTSLADDCRQWRRWAWRSRFIRFIGQGAVAYSYRGSSNCINHYQYQRSGAVSSVQPAGLLSCCGCPALSINRKTYR